MHISMIGGNMFGRTSFAMVHSLSRWHHYFLKTPWEQITRLRAVFEKLAKAGVKHKPSKCEFFKRWITYLGHIISKDGIETDPIKIEAIVNWPRPTTVTDVCCFGDLPITTEDLYINMPTLLDHWMC